MDMMQRENAKSVGEIHETFNGRSDRPWGDAALMFVVFVAACVWSTLLYRQLIPTVSTNATNNHYYQGDLRDVYETMVSLNGHHRTVRHPLQSLATTGPVYSLTRVGMSKEDAVGAVLALATGIWLASSYLVVRGLQFHRLDSILLCALMLSSSAAVFWCGVPESYVFGGASIMAALAMAGWSLRWVRHPPAWLFVLINVVSLSITSTHWMMGGLATLARFPVRRAVQIIANGFVVTCVLWAIQARVVPGTLFFLSPTEFDRNYVFHEYAGSLSNKAAVIFSHAVIMPAFETNRVVWSGKEHALLSVQHVNPGTGGALTLSATVIWCVLLVGGTISIIRIKPYGGVRVVILAFLAGQILLHLIYGDETFLYTMHFVAVLVIVAGHILLTVVRLPARIMLVLLVFLAAWNNLQHLEHSIIEIRKDSAGIVGQSPVFSITQR